MPFPSAVRDVPRDEVGETVDGLLLNPEVGDVDCVQQDDGNYTVTPHRTAG